MGDVKVGTRWRVKRETNITLTPNLYSEGPPPLKTLAKMRPGDGLTVLHSGVRIVEDDSTSAAWVRVATDLGLVGLLHADWFDKYNMSWESS